MISSVACNFRLILDAPLIKPLTAEIRATICDSVSYYEPPKSLDYDASSSSHRL